MEEFEFPTTRPQDFRVLRVSNSRPYRLLSCCFLNLYTYLYTLHTNVYHVCINIYLYMRLWVRIGAMKFQKSKLYNFGRFYQLRPSFARKTELPPIRLSSLPHVQCSWTFNKVLARSGLELFDYYVRNVFPTFYIERLRSNCCFRVVERVFNFHDSWMESLVQ